MSATPAALPPPPPAPPGLNPDAFHPLEALVKDCGKTVFRMPTSCELYLRQYLADFPAERAALTTALKHQVPSQVLEAAERAGYVEELQAVAADLARAAQMSDDVARWAVLAWATALNRPPGYVPPTLSAKREAAKTVEHKPPPPSRLARAVMAAVPGAGGFLGGLFGNHVGELVVQIAGAAAKARIHNRGNLDPASEAAIVWAVLLMLLGGVTGGVGGFTGWLHGRGDHRPWAGFAAACGGAFGAGCVGYLLAGAGGWTATIILGAAFGSAFTTATRGGYKEW
jgi:hypothetical protein